MNQFEEKFFLKYVPNWEVLKWVIHQHWLGIVNILILWLSLWALIPSFLYYYSERLKELIPFYYLEWLLIFIFIKVIYEIFNWYNDVWIITNQWVVELEWALFSTNMKTVKYENIEWVEVEQYWIWDTVFNKWDIVIAKIWDDEFRLFNAKIPYDAVNKIEKFSKEKWEESNNEKMDKFDIIMEALSWVVEDYLDKKWTSKKTKKELKNHDEKEEEISEQFVNKYKKIPTNSIDLR